MASIPLDELAPDELPGAAGAAAAASAPAAPVPDAVAEGLLPQLPPWLDSIVGVVLTFFPVIVIVSWVGFSVASYQESEKAKKRDQKRKITKAMKIEDDKYLPDSQKLRELEGPSPDLQKSKKRRKKTALIEAMELDE